MNWTDFMIAIRQGLIPSKKDVDNIQTTSKGSLTAVGWYRVAEYESTTSSASGTQGNSCTLVIKNNNGNYHKVFLESSYASQKFVAIESVAKTHVFTKIRYVKQGTVAYLEVYFDSSTKYSCAFTVSNGNDYYFNWKAITPVLTEETVDGATVTTTYDIPAYASPINDNDLANGSYPLGVVGKDRIILYPDGGTFDSTENLTGQIRITLPQSWANTRISFKVLISSLASGISTEYTISGYTSSSSSAWTGAEATCTGSLNHNVYFAHDGSKCVVCIGEVDSSWNKAKVQVTDVMVGHYVYRYDYWNKGWNIGIVADNSDLTVSRTAEKPNVFEKYNESLNQFNSVTVTTSVLEYALTLATGTYQIYLGGSNYTGDDLPNKSYRYGRATIYKAGSRATVVLYGIKGVEGAKRIAMNHYDSGWGGWETYSTTADLEKYLPLNGGGKVSKTSALPFGIENTSGTTCYASFYGKDGVLGYLGFIEQDSPVFVTADQTVAKRLLHNGNFSEYALPLAGGNVDSLTVSNKTVHHDGNSAKVHIGTSAPSDTSSLWIDTSA